MKKLSSWTNLQDVFAANAGQGARMNDDVFGSLEAEGAAARQKLNDARTGFERKSQQARTSAFDGLDLKTSGGLEAASQRTYQGPRTLSEYDPNVSAAIGDAAQRINGNLADQYATKYGNRGSAMGGALDQALMAQEGAGARQEQLKTRYGDLRGDLSRAQKRSQAEGAASDEAIRNEAIRLASLAPGMRQDEALRARRKLEQELWQRNEAARAAYDADWERRTAAFKRRRGNELQAAYLPPESEELPFYPAS